MSQLEFLRRRILLRFLRPGAIVLLAIAATAAPASAQYFGQNQVQYDRFDFQILKTEHFDIYFYPEEEAAAKIAARLAERWYVRLSKLLNHELRGRQPLILYASAPHFRQTNVIGGEPGEGTGGVTESFRRRIVLPFAGGLAETDHVIGHELVHAFQFDITAQINQRGGAGAPVALAMPLWFIEGMAEYLSLGPVNALTAMWLRDAAAREALPAIRDLDDPRFFPYRYGHAFWAYVAGRWGDEMVGELLRSAGPNTTLDDLFTAVLGVDEKTLSAEWHESIRKTYAPILEATAPAAKFATPLINAERGGGEVNVGPSLSPDGTRIVFLSERDLFSIDMYLADAQTGEVIRRIVRTAANPHFQSLQFLNSAGAWSPDGSQFVFAALSGGDPVLTVLDAKSGRTLREIKLEDLGEIYNPSWSPDGRRVAFSALQGGLLDLYLCEIESGKLDRLTSDPYAELDPEWSPDGRSLVYSTDRFGSNIEQLSFGNYRLARIDLGSREVAPLNSFEEGNNLSPHWLPDGRSILFVASPDGISNIYRLDTTTGAVTRYTNVTSGVSGITALSPALSVASESGRVAFTVFEGDKYGIYTLESGAVKPVGDPFPTRIATVLPPPREPAGAVAGLLQRPHVGLPPPDAPTEVVDYKPSLGLDYVAQPSVGVGVDRFGAYASGGIGFVFSDMLGNHTLLTAAQIDGEFEDFGGTVFYLNRRQRWNWGLIAEQMPYRSGAFSAGFTEIDGQPAFVEQALIFRQTNRGLSGIAQYPFSRAQRLEFTGGFRNIGFDTELTTDIFDPVTGVLISTEERDLESPDSLNLGEAGAALVYDTAILGAVGPLYGQRYRFEVNQTAGSLRYTGVLADYRRYVMPVRPFTIAGRILHYGRYGSDGEDTRLAPLYLGYPQFMRGYDVGSFDAGECGVQPDGSCPVFDQLIGSRMLVTNLELRFPLLGLFSRDRRSYYGPLPIELALFGDAGVAWTSDTDPSFAGGDRDWVRSAGIALRANLLGFAVVEVDYARPFDRPGKGWVWQFSFTPAF